MRADAIYLATKIAFDDERLNADACDRDNKTRLLLTRSRPLSSTSAITTIANIDTTAATIVEDQTVSAVATVEELELSRVNNIVENSRIERPVIDNKLDQASLSSNVIQKYEDQSEEIRSSESVANPQNRSSNHKSNSIAMIVSLVAHLNRAKKDLDRIGLLLRLSSQHNIRSYQTNTTQEQNSSNNSYDFDESFTSDLARSDGESNSSSVSNLQDGDNGEMPNNSQSNKTVSDPVDQETSEFPLSLVDGSDLLSIIQSLAEQQRELRNMDRQISHLIEKHIQSYAVSSESFHGNSLPDLVANHPFKKNDPDVELVAKSTSVELVESSTNSSPDEVIDLTCKTSGMIRESLKQQVDLQRPMIFDYSKPSDTQTNKKCSSNQLFTSPNVRKSRLLSATLEKIQQNRIPYDSLERELKVKPEVVSFDTDTSTNESSLENRTIQREQYPLSGSQKPDFSPATDQKEPTRNMQTKRIRLSTIPFNSDYFNESSPSSTSCSAIQTESNIDLLRDFMLHNQYLPSHLVLECFSQCQKQTSSSSISLAPSAISTIDALSTARNQTGHEAHVDYRPTNLDVAQRGCGSFPDFNGCQTDTTLNRAKAFLMTAHDSNLEHSDIHCRAKISSYDQSLPMNNAQMLNCNQQHYHHHHQQTSQEAHEYIGATISGSNQHSISVSDIQRVAFKCHVCGSGFEDRHRLQQHLSIHLNLQPSWFEEKTITATMTQYESKRGDYICRICDLRFETTAEFDKHMQVHGDKPHRCDLCNQDKLVSFRYYKQLLTHLRSHCFLYSCRFAPDCKQTSNRKDYLKLHILKHHLNNQLPQQYTLCCH